MVILDTIKVLDHKYTKRGYTKLNSLLYTPCKFPALEPDNLKARQKISVTSDSYQIWTVE